jgi:hypothetical protein
VGGDALIDLPAGKPFIVVGFRQAGGALTTGTWRVVATESSEVVATEVGRN